MNLSLVYFNIKSVGISTLWSDNSITTTTTTDDQQVTIKFYFKSFYHHLTFVYDSVAHTGRRSLWHTLANFSTAIEVA